MNESLNTKNPQLKASQSGTQEAKKGRPGRSASVDYSQHQLVFALLPGDVKNPGANPKLLPLTGRVEGGALTEVRSYTQSRHPFKLSKGDEQLHQKVHKLHAMERLRHQAETHQLLLDLMAAQRLYLHGHYTRPLQEGASRPYAATWQMDSESVQHASLKVLPEAQVMLLQKPWFVDPERLELGVVLCELETHQIMHFMTAPPVTPESVQRVREALTHLVGKALPLPQVIAENHIQGQLVPQLKLSTREWQIGALKAPVPYAELSFTYMGKVVQGPELRQRNVNPPALQVHGAGRILHVQRDLQAEHQAVVTLQGLGFVATTSNIQSLEFRFGEHHHFTLEKEWLQCMDALVPQLRSKGWKIVLDEAFPLKVHEADLEGYLGQDEEGFLLDLGVRIHEELIPLLPMLRDWLQQHPAELRELLVREDMQLTEYLPVKSHGYVRLEMHQLKSILQLIQEHHPEGSKSKILKIPRLAIGHLHTLDQENRISWTGSRDVMVFARQLHQLGRPHTPALPEDLKADLRPYQHEGVGWLQLLRESNCKGILADDMGLGKTLQTLAHVLMLKKQGQLRQPVLVIAPSSLMGNWISEAARFTPTLRTVLLHGSSRRKQYADLEKADLVLTTYTLLRVDLDLLREHTFDTIILDEAQNIKNHQSKTSKALGHLKSKHRLCLTGTPLENHLGELWSLFHFLMPGLLPKESVFRKAYRDPIELCGDNERQQKLMRMLKPVVLRRTKGQVARDLPEKTEIVLNLQMEEPQEELYGRLRERLERRVLQEIETRGLAKSHMCILDALMKLRQVCCDPRLLPEGTVTAQGLEAHTHSVKLEWLRDTLPGMLEEGRTVLLFSQFTSMLRLIQQELQGLGIEHAMLTGDTKDRQKQIEMFQSGEVKVFLISLKAGGVGLNLTAADTVVHFDPWWNPAVENQATDRAHRIGQDKPVFVYKLVTSGTIEEKILALQHRKAQLAQGILEGSLGAGMVLSDQDVAELFR